MAKIRTITNTVIIILSTSPNKPLFLILSKEILQETYIYLTVIHKNPNKDKTYKKCGRSKQVRNYSTPNTIAISSFPFHKINNALSVINLTSLTNNPISSLKLLIIKAPKKTS